MTPTPKRANSKKKIRESLSLVVNAIIPLEARAPKRVLNSFGKRAFLSLFSRVSLSRSRVVQRPRHDHAHTQNATAPKPFCTKVSKAVIKSRYLQNRRNRRRSGQRVQRDTQYAGCSLFYDPATTSSRDERKRVVIACVARSRF